MKKFQKLTTILFVVGFLFSYQSAESQLLKKLKQRTKRAAEEAVIRKTEQKVYKETSKKMDTILGNNGKTKGNKNNEQQTTTPKKQNQADVKSKKNSLEEVGENEVGFKRGTHILYKDNFSQDAVGDFPAKWNTNLGGEVKKLKGFDNKFLRVPAKSVINLQTTKPFPKNFTAEMDIIIPEDAPIRMAALGFGKKVPDHIDYLLTDEDNIHIMFTSDVNYGEDAIKFGTRNQSLGYTYKSVKYRIPINQKIHLGFEVNGKRFRVFVDGKKMIDLPTFYKPEFSNKFFVSAVTHGNPKSLENYFYISNIVIAETGTDIRSSVQKDLIEKGRFSTNEILFASGSDKIQDSSNEILNQIGEAMQNNASVKFKIIGHTDSEGDTKSNQVLSEKRASSVKNYLISNFNIFARNLSVEGKGESDPIADNNTAAGKAKNRRVEFIKI